jgi:hypothetical protein
MQKKTVLYITTDLLFSEVAKAGGAVVQKSHLSILLNLGYKIKILYVNCDKFSYKEPTIIKENQLILYDNNTISVDEIHLNITKKTNFSVLKKFFKIVFNPTEYYYSFINSKNQQFLNNYLKNLNFNLIWAQWFYAGLLCSNQKISQPTFYVHHDWQYKLTKFKKTLNLKNIFLMLSKKRVEFSFISKFKSVICLSNSDAKLLNSKKINSFYLPITYNNIIANQLKPKENPSLIHLGSLNTTANRVGLKNFLNNSWVQIKITIPNIKLEVIGEMPNNDDELKNLLEKDNHIKLHNFVKDLDSIMYPQDIHIVPWHKDTGTRTRVPLILQYEQCLAARKEGVKNLKEIVNKENAILSSNWEEFTKDIIKLYFDKKLRKQLTNNGVKTFSKFYRHSFQAEKLNIYIKKNM